VHATLRRGLLVLLNGHENLLGSGEPMLDALLDKYSAQSCHVERTPS
jgi:hypothetical protein